MFPNAQFNVIINKNVETDIDDMENYHLILKNPANDTGEAIGLAFGITDTTIKLVLQFFMKETVQAQGSLKFLTRPVTQAHHTK